MNIFLLKNSLQANLKKRALAIENFNNIYTARNPKMGSLARSCPEFEPGKPTTPKIHFRIVSGISVQHELKKQADVL